MDIQLKQTFLSNWERFFGDQEIPLVFFFEDEPSGEMQEKPTGHQCMICPLNKVRKGRAISFNAASLGCGGAGMYCGFHEIRPDLPEFLSTGCERYIDTPGHAAQMIAQIPHFKAPKPYITFMPFDQLEAHHKPDAVIFFGNGDLLSGLFTWTNFGANDINAVFSPFGSGCSLIITYPRDENSKENPRAVLGMFDVSARPCVKPQELTFSIPFRRFEKMIPEMTECFFITHDWERVKKRLNK